MHYDIMRPKHKSVSESGCASRGVKLSDRFHMNELLWGRLESVGMNQDGLVDVVLTGQGCLAVVAQVSLELASKLRPMVGQQVIIGHVEGRWVCGTKMTREGP